MAHFPVSSSNLSAVHLAIFLREQYAFGECARCRLLRAGINHTYLVQDGSAQYIFRVYSLDWRTQTEIEEEIRLLNLLKAKHLPVSYALPDRHNNYLQRLNAPEGERFGLLFSYAKGHKEHDLSAETHYRIGSLMAQLHAVTGQLRLERVNYTPEVVLMEPLSQIARFLSADSAEMAYLQQLQKILLQMWTNAAEAGLRRGVVHLDIWFDNINVTDGQEVTIFDFDFCGNGWLCMDIAYYVMQLHNIDRYEEKLYQPKIAQFLAGYESVIPLSEEEKQLLPMLGVSLYFFYLGVQCRRFDNWSNTFLSENYLKRFINGLVKRYADIYQLTA